VYLSVNPHITRYCNWVCQTNFHKFLIVVCLYLECSCRVFRLRYAYIYFGKGYYNAYFRISLNILINAGKVLGAHSIDKVALESYSVNRHTSSFILLIMLNTALDFDPSLQYYNHCRKEVHRDLLLLHT